MQECRDDETCKECGGSCCRIYSIKCRGQKEDWQDTFDKSSATGLVEPIYNPLEEYRVECQYLGDNGCIIPWEFRPRVCKEYKCKTLKTAMERKKL